MKIYPHAPSEAVLSRILSTSRERFVPAHARTPELLASRNELFWGMNTATAVECAALSYALETPDGVVLDFLREASQCCADALDAGAPLGMTQVAEQLSVALVLGQADLARTLADLPSQRYALPGVTVPPVLHTLFQVYGQLAAGRADAAAQQLRELDGPHALDKLPRPRKVLADAARRMQHAIVDRDAAGFGQALDAHLDGHARLFRDPTLNNYPQGLLDLEALGLVQLARGAGMAVATDSVYCPLSLLA